MYASIHKYKPIRTKLGQTLYDPKILDEFDYGSNWTQATRVICRSIRVSVFDLVYTLASICIYDANLKIFMFEPKRLRALKLRMNHHVADVYKVFTQDAPGLITGPVMGLRNLYVSICQPIKRNFSG